MIVEKNNKENVLLDLLKFFACFLIVGSHCFPLFKNENYEYIYCQWFFRFCVPVFIISCGYFFSKMDFSKKKKYLIRLIILFIISSLLYSPFIFAPYQTKTNTIKYLILGYNHLWYISGMIGGLALFLIFNKKITSMKTSSIIVLISVFILVSAFVDEYYKVIHISTIQNIGMFFQTYLDGGRNFLFFSFPLILIGYLVYKHQDTFKIKTCFILLPISSLLSLVESLFLKKYITYGVSADITLVNYIPALLLVILALKIRIKTNFNTKFIRKLSDCIYIIHPFVIYYFKSKKEIFYVKLCIYSFIVSLGISCLYLIISKLKPSK